MKIRKITPGDDAAIAAIIRHNLKQNNLALPGTVYFDEGLEHLSEFYTASPKRDYFVAVDAQERVAGGIGFAEFGALENCAELQKLYLDDAVKGHGYGYDLIEHVIETARRIGYGQIYLETHSNLEAAIHMYEKSGFHRIEKLDACVHSAMNRFMLMPLEEKQ